MLTWSNPTNQRPPASTSAGGRSGAAPVGPLAHPPAGPPTLLPDVAAPAARSHPDASSRMRPPAALPRRARSSERIAPDALPRRTVSYRRPGLPPLDASSRIAETHGLELVSRRHRSRVRFPMPLLRTHYPGRRLCGFAWGTPSRHAASKACCLEGAVPDAPSHRAALRIPFRIPRPL